MTYYFLIGQNSYYNHHLKSSNYSSSPCTFATCACITSIFAFSKALKAIFKSPLAFSRSTGFDEVLPSRRYSLPVGIKLPSWSTLPAHTTALPSLTF